MAGRLWLRRLAAYSRLQTSSSRLSTTTADSLLTSLATTYRRFIHSKSQDPVADNFLEVESCSSGVSTASISQEAHKSGDQAPVANTRDLSKLKRSSRHDLVMIFTCKVCETRSVRTTCRQSYEKGIVVARCDGCNNLHLMADHLGWFGEPGSVEDLLAARGEEVKKGSTDSLNFTLEDLVGSKP